jgi:hypothetical protein
MDEKWGVEGWEPAVQRNLCPGRCYFCRPYHRRHSSSRCLRAQLRAPVLSYLKYLSKNPAPQLTSRALKRCEKKLFYLMQVNIYISPKSWTNAVINPCNIILLVTIIAEIELDKYIN